MDAIGERIAALNDRLHDLQSRNLYFYQLPSTALDGPWVTINNRKMLMLASYSYLGLMGHPNITKPPATRRSAMARGRMACACWPAR
jgi:hypothetical protein